jgi:hypothetical protein
LRVFSDGRSRPDLNEPQAPDERPCEESSALTASPTPRTGWLVARVALVVALCLLSLVVLELSFPAALLAVVVFLSLPREPARLRKRASLALGLAATIAAVSSVRFIITRATTGIVLGGQAAMAKSALYRLREIVRAEDAMRVHAKIDPDGDGVGSAAFIAELMGVVPLRARATLDPPLLNQRYARLFETPVGPAAVANAYLILVCLPTAGGGWTARPGDAVDEEAAERMFAAYAWPMDGRRDPGTVFFVDARENILVSANRDQRGQPLWSGPSFPPPCDAAPGPAFAVWQDKRPRETLPGDRR